MRKVIGTLCLALALAAALLVPGPAAGAGPAAPAVPVPVETQRTIFDHLGAVRKDAHWVPALNQPAGYVSPANYRDGRALLRVVVTGKPSTKPLWVSVCMWRHNGVLRYFWETCSSTGTFAANGTYFFDLGSPGRWWKKNGIWDWTKQASDIRLMVKDPVSGKLMLTQQCGANCYTGTGIDAHVPFTMKSELIMVAQGATLKPPTGWTPACPNTWSPGC